MAVKSKCCFILFIMFMLLVMTCGSISAEPKKVKEQESSEYKPKYTKHIIVVNLLAKQAPNFNLGQTPTIYGLGKEGIEFEGVVHPRVVSIEQANNWSLNYNNNEKNLAATYKEMARKTLWLNLGSKSNQSELQPSFSIYETEFSKFLKSFAQQKPFFSLISVAVDDRTGVKLNEIDSLMAKLIGNLHSLGVYDNTCILVIGLQKDNSSINLGKGVIKGVNLKNGFKAPICRIEDLATTIYYATDGKKLSENGDVLWSLFKSESPQSEINLLSKRINDLSQRQYELLQLEYSFQETKENLAKDKLALENKRKKIEHEISVRDQIITREVMEKRIIIIGSIIVFIIMIIGYFVEYYVLRKRFMLF